MLRPIIKPKSAEAGLESLEHFEDTCPEKFGDAHHELRWALQQVLSDDIRSDGG